MSLIFTHVGEDFAGAAKRQEQKTKLLAKSTGLLRENRRLKEELQLWQEELSFQKHKESHARSLV